MNITIDFYWILSILFLIFTKQGETYFIFYFFIFLHELAHILMAVLLKVKVEEISFLPVGVNAKFDFKKKKGKEIVVAMAGPVFSLLLAFFFPKYKVENCWIAILNLLPIAPLDGGRILKNTLWLVFGMEKGMERYQAFLRGFLILFVIFSVIQIVFLRNYFMIFSMLYLFQMVKEELKKDRIRRMVKALLNLEI